MSFGSLLAGCLRHHSRRGWASAAPTPQRSTPRTINTASNASSPYRDRNLNTRVQALHVEHAEGFLLPLEVCRWQLLINELAAELGQRRLAHQDLPGVGHAAQARAGVRGVTDHGVGERLRAADVTGDERA